MQVSDLMQIVDLKLINEDLELDKKVSGFYSCDLLSWVMGHIRDDKMVLITVMASINVIAVATLLDMSAVIFVEGANPTEEVIQKANEEQIALFTTNRSSLQIYKEICKYESLL